MPVLPEEGGGGLRGDLGLGGSVLPFPTGEAADLPPLRDVGRGEAVLGEPAPGEGLEDKEGLRGDGPRAEPDGDGAVRPGRGEGDRLLFAGRGGGERGEARDEPTRGDVGLGLGLGTGEATKGSTVAKTGAFGGGAPSRAALRDWIRASCLACFSRLAATALGSPYSAAIALRLASTSALAGGGRSKASARIAAASAAFAASSALMTFVLGASPLPELNSDSSCSAVIALQAKSLMIKKSLMTPLTARLERRLKDPSLLALL